MKKCIECGEALRAGEVQQSIEVAGRKYVKSVPSQQCSNGHSYVSASELGQLELEAAASIADSGEVSGETFRFMRKSLGMTAQALAPLIGVTNATISRWEHGERDPELNAWVTLGTLVTEKRDGRSWTLARLRKAALGKKAPRGVVRLGPAPKAQAKRRRAGG